MGTKKYEKINNLLRSLPSSVVITSSWLVEEGYSLDLQKRYKKSRWFESIGSGALVRYEDQVDYLGGVYALQTQLGLSVHPGAKTALSLQGKAHYLEMSAEKAQLFVCPGENVPLWFKKYNWGLALELTSTSFLPADLGLVDVEHKSFSVKVSNPARAVMECLYSVPKSQPLLEVYEIMEGLNNLRPASVQALLEACKSVKVKRLFLYLAEKAGHDWFNYLDLKKVDLGSGKRLIVQGGTYVPKYQITVPKELEVVS